MEQKLFTCQRRGGIAATVKDAAAEKHVPLRQAEGKIVYAYCGFHGLWNV